MKNYAKCLLLLAFISYAIFICSTVDDVAVGYLHDKILEETVPELKEFNNKLTVLFRIKDYNEKIKATQELLKFVDETKRKLNSEIKVRKMTAAEIKGIKIVLDIMKRRVGKLRNLNNSSGTSHLNSVTRNQKV